MAKKWSELYPVLNLNDLHVKLLYDNFEEIDEDDSGAIAIEEFYAFFHFTYQTPLTKRFFEMFDIDGR